MEQNSLLQRYRFDRRKLLEFLLSSGLIREFRTPSGPSTSLSAINFDNLSADYILQCVKSSGVVDVSEASKEYYAESRYPIMNHSQLGDSYFLVSDPDLAGSPPRRVPPPLHVHQSSNHFHSSHHLDSSNAQDISASGGDHVLKHNKATIKCERPVENSKVLLLGIPDLRTGLSDDDLRESAYELLLVSMLISGVEVYSVEDRKKEKSSKFLSRLKSKRDKTDFQPQPLEKQSELINIIRGQMQISETMDACIRRNLVQLAGRANYGQIDLPQIALGLLIGIFKSDFLNEKSYMQWKRRQTNILEELLCFSPNLVSTEHLMVRSCLAKIRDAKQWEVTMSPSQRVEVLSAVRQVALKLSSLPGKFNIQDETYYWTAAYHMNIRLYEKLLCGVFDILDEGQLIEEADFILLHIKSAWSTLGITQILHNAMYGWVLFKQFVETDEGLLLEYAVRELQQVNSAEGDNANESHYMNSLVCSKHHNGSETAFSLVHAIFFSISIWCDNTLQDYHVYFDQKPYNFKRVMSLASTVGVYTSTANGELKLLNFNALNDDTGRKIEIYVKRSIEAACCQAIKTVDLEAKVERTHPLALLANKLKLIAKRELNEFCPVLRDWLPQCMMISALLLHQFYGERLKPFLEGVSSLSKDVRSVLPAADMLDHDLTQLYTYTFEESTLHNLNQNLNHYQIREVSTPIILDWVIAQHAHIVEWTGRALDLENWEPLSLQQKQAASIIEVFRIIEETVDQLFGLNLPLDITHLQALLSVIYHSLDVYVLRLLNHLVEKKSLYPSAPPLTRFTETVIPIMKKKLLEPTILDENVITKLNDLTISKLCVRVNTLQYIHKKMGILEDGIRKSWALVRPSFTQRLEKEHTETSEKNMFTQSEAVDELFATTFSSIRDTTTNVINKIYDLIGARVIFWDLRDMFLLHLYRGNVERARLESILPHIDTVLDHICGLVDDAVRDIVVLSICRAALEAYAWVLLDGGPSRSFSDSDIFLMEEDLNILKEFFIADGEGLPRSLVEQEAKFVEQILALFSLETGTVIQMLMTASELISMGLESHKRGHMRMEDAHTLVRVLCHKKDREASKFLKKQYQFPMSSEYDDTPKETSLKSPLISDLLKRSTSFHWRKESQSSFKSIKKIFQEATSDMRNVTR